MASQHIGKPFALHHIDRALRRRVIPDRCLKAYAQSPDAGEVLKCVQVFTSSIFTSMKPSPLRILRWISHSQGTIVTDIDVMERRLRDMQNQIDPGRFSIIPWKTYHTNSSYFKYRDLAVVQTKRQARIRRVCEAKQLQASKGKLSPGETEYHEGWNNKGTLYKTVEVYRLQNFLFCPVLKVGSTFFRRLFFAMSHGKAIVSPYEIPTKTALKSRRETLFGFGRQLSFRRQPGNQLRQSTTYNMFSDKGAQWQTTDNVLEKLVRGFLLSAGKIMFTRDPYSKLLSGYVDKLFAPNPFFWKAIGRVIIRHFRKDASKKSRRCGHDVTFSEFIQYVIENERNNGLGRDAHFVPSYDRCKPCDISYDVVGKMETFPQDISLLVAQLGHNLSQATLDLWAHQSEADAIYDSILSPYSWRKDVLKCMSWSEANRRIMRKLQIRGFLHKNVSLSADSIGNYNFARHSFMQFIKRSWKQFSATGLKAKQKREALSSAYSSVPRKDLELLREYFLLDFDLFGYESRPDYIFNASESWDVFNVNATLYKSKF